MDKEQKPTLSMAEQEWFGNWFKSLESIQTETLKTLHAINICIQILVIIAFLSLVLATCGSFLPALSH
jgi:hypothetical protein